MQPKRNPSLISQAIVHGLVLLSPDDQIAPYPVRVLW